MRAPYSNMPRAERKIFIFASRDGESWAPARALAAETGAQLIDRLSNSLEALRLVVRYGVVEPVVIVVTHGADVALRVPRLLTRQELEADLSRLSPP